VRGETEAPGRVLLLSCVVLSACSYYFMGCESLLGAVTVLCGLCHLLQHPQQRNTHFEHRLSGLL
jgi:hypothetical protein